MEALIGALYIEFGGSLESVRPFVKKYIIEPYLVDVLTEAVDNPWGSHREPSAIYEEICNIAKCVHLREDYTAPSDDSGCYDMHVMIHGTQLPYIGRGSNKKSAKADMTKQLINDGPLALLNIIRRMCSCRSSSSEMND